METSKNRMRSTFNDNIEESEHVVLKTPNLTLTSCEGIKPIPSSH